MLRGLAAAGAAAWLAGAWSGWFREEVSGELVRPHHLATTGWVWLAALPLLLAAVAPFTRRWLRWLCVAALIPLAAAAIAFVLEPGTHTEFPYMLSLDERRLGLPLSLAGAGLAVVALVLALRAAPRDRAPAQHARRFAVAALVAALAVSAAVLREDLAHEGLEARIEREVRAECDDGSLESVRVHCSRAGWCATQTAGEGSKTRSRGFGADSGWTSYAPLC